MWRKPNKTMVPAFQPEIIQVGVVSVMVQGLFIWHSVGPLVRLETSLIGERYVRILSDWLHPRMLVESILRSKSAVLRPPGGGRLTEYYSSVPFF